MGRGLNDLFALVAGRFPRVEPRLQARAYVRGLLAPLASKNGWTLAEAAGNKTPDKMQRLLNRAGWNDDGVRDDVRGYVARHLQPWPDDLRPAKTPARGPHPSDGARQLHQPRTPREDRVKT
jgi:SRSO17 transposase